MVCSINPFRAFSTHRIAKRDRSRRCGADKLLNLAVRGSEGVAFFSCRAKSRHLQLIPRGSLAPNQSSVDSTSRSVSLFWRAIDATNETPFFKLYPAVMCELSGGIAAQSPENI